MQYHKVIVILLSTGLLCSVIFIPYHVVDGKRIIGTQRMVETPNGKLTQCSGNLLIPSTICAGTNHNDTIVDQLYRGTIYGKGGDDKIQGLLGGEVVFGNDGNDQIQGGNGSATLFGNDGDDVIVGEIASSLLTGGGGSTLYGGNGDDHLIGGVEHDVLVGGPGHDLFSCGGKEDIVIDYDPIADNVTGNCVKV